VVSDVLGVSARAMLKEIAEGSDDASALAALAKGRLRHKITELEEALTGLVDPHHRFILAQQLAHIDFLDQQVETLSQEIGQQLQRMSHPNAEPPNPPSDSTVSDEPSPLKPTIPDHLTWENAVHLLDTIPGVDVRTAEVILAEIGLDMAQFPTADDLAAWAGLAPGSYESGGKRYSGRTTKGNKPLRAIMSQAAWAASRTKGTYLKARYHRLAARRGKKRAIVATARSMLVSAWHMLSRGEPYLDLGADYFDQRKKESKVDYLSKQLTKLGFSVTLDPIPTPS
jgi:transposase